MKNTNEMNKKIDKKIYNIKIEKIL